MQMIIVKQKYEDKQMFQWIFWFKNVNTWSFLMFNNILLYRVKRWWSILTFQCFQPSSIEITSQLMQNAWNNFDIVCILNIPMNLVYKILVQWFANTMSHKIRNAFSVLVMLVHVRCERIRNSFIHANTFAKRQLCER